MMNPGESMQQFSAKQLEYITQDKAIADKIKALQKKVFLDNQFYFYITLIITDTDDLMISCTHTYHQLIHSFIE